MSSQNVYPICYKIKTNIDGELKWPVAVKQSTLDAFIQMMKSDKMKSIVERIRAGESELKQKLPAFYPFDVKNPAKGISKEQDNIIYSGIMVFDYDLCKKEPFTNTKEKALELRERLMNSDLKTNLLFCFSSPSGGLKFALKTNIKDAGLYSYAYKSITDNFKSKGVQLDESTKDANRATFVSYDPELYYNPEAPEADLESLYKEDYLKSKAFSEERIKKAKAAFEELAGEHDEKRAYASMIRALEANFASTFKGNRNNNMWELAKIVFRHGYDAEMLYHVYQLAIQNGAGDPDVRDLVADAKRRHGQWLDAGGTPSLKFYKTKTVTTEDLFD